MRKTIIRLIAAAMLIAVPTLPVAAQVHFGPKVGVAIDKLSFDKNVFSSDNRAGFTGGLTLEVMLPVANLGFDISAMYVHRSSDVLDMEDRDETTGAYAVEKNNRDYIEIPLNLKYKIGLPIVGRIVTPYVFTGPSFAFLTSKKAINDAMRNKTFDVAWNFGVGLQLINKIQIGASYGLGMTKAVKAFDSDVDGANIDGKNRYWTVTAAYFF